MNGHHYRTPLEVEDAFYRAFENNDAAAMSRVWAEDEDIECIHPVGPRLRGAAVHGSWREVFSDGEPVAIHVSDRQQFGAGDTVVHLVTENFLFLDPRSEALRLLATNVYRHDQAAGWRMVLHHCSPDPRAAQVPDSPPTLH